MFSNTRHRTIEWGDCDPAGIVFNPRYFEWFDAATAASVRVGERPIPGDGLPVLGRVARLPNFHFAVSHSGATLSLHAGDLVAAEVVGEDREEALAPFRFERLSAPA